MLREKVQYTRKKNILIFRGSFSKMIFALIYIKNGTAYARASDSIDGNIFNYFFLCARASNQGERMNKASRYGVCLNGQLVNINR